MARLRRRSPVVALGVALSLIGLLSADWIAAVHGDDDDARHEQALGLWSTGSGARVGAGNGGASPEHCAICHWLRSLKSLAAAAGLVSGAITLCRPLGAEPMPRVIATAVVHVPTRAPPTSAAPA